MKVIKYFADTDAVLPYDKVVFKKLNDNGDYVFKSVNKSSQAYHDVIDSSEWQFVREWEAGTKRSRYENEFESIKEAAS